MVDSILSRLQVKNAPKKYQPPQIKLDKPDPKTTIGHRITTEIIDQRSRNIDRQVALSKIKNINIETRIRESEDVLADTPYQPSFYESKIKQTPSERPTKSPTDRTADLSAEFNPDRNARKVKRLQLTADIKNISNTRATLQGLKLPTPRESRRISPISLVDIEEIAQNLPSNDKMPKLRASEYYLNNRAVFVDYVAKLFEPYQKEIDDSDDTYNCNDATSTEFNLLTHQNIVRDYINLFTPYRGLLLYHGLGSGKTCSSIAIAEGLKSELPILVMTPASLQVNYREELKKCGDILYKTNNYWEFINIKKNSHLIQGISPVLSLSEDFIRKNKGAWFVNKNKKPNYEQLTQDEKINLDKQITKMIENKYLFVNYNGLRKSHNLIAMINNGSNPFSNKVIIIDEAHNFVSKIVNKLKRPGSMFLKLYKSLMEAENCRIVLLTGTPIINYPNESAIMLNILRGKIKVWEFQLSTKGNQGISYEELLTIFNKNKKTSQLLDDIKFNANSNILKITRNPFGFLSTYGEEDNVYKGVNNKMKDGNITDAEFVKIITELLLKNGISIIPNSADVQTLLCLPDRLDSFSAEFIGEDNKVNNMDKFKKRILGLVSYFPDIDKLLPKYEKDENFHVIKIEMSDFQFNIYEEARVQERKVETRNARKRKQGGPTAYDDTVSTYRIFSRAFCNFVFPRPEINRPLPRDDLDVATNLEKVGDEDVLDAFTTEKKLKEEDIVPDKDLIKENTKDHLLETGGETASEVVQQNITYEQRIQQSIKKLEENKELYLTPEKLQTYSPKFLHILNNILLEEHRGLHLVYSQFRTLEGIGIFSLVLKTNGFAEFKLIKNDSGDYLIDIADEDIGKPKYVLYTGTETAEVKELIRNVFNGNWEKIQPRLRAQLEAMSNNNYFGEIIKVFMITASGAEGISLKNVRYVHITEPYWHPVRTEQVIGRARRICSHKDLPVELQTVEVFLYLMIFSLAQLSSDNSIELRLKDKSKKDHITPLTSDQALYEIATIKETINKNILHNLKEASIDCTIHTTINNKEKLNCFSFGTVEPSKFAYAADINDEETDKYSGINKVKKEIKGTLHVIDGVEYIVDFDTNDVYNYKSYMLNNPRKIGKIERPDEKHIEIVLF